MEIGSTNFLLAFLLLIYLMELMALVDFLLLFGSRDVFTFFRGDFSLIVELFDLLKFSN